MTLSMMDAKLTAFAYRLSGRSPILSHVAPLPALSLPRCIGFAYSDIKVSLILRSLGIFSKCLFSLYTCNEQSVQSYSDPVATAVVAVDRSSHFEDNSGSSVQRMDTEQAHAATKLQNTSTDSQNKFYRLVITPMT